MSKVQVSTHTFPKRFSELVLHELDPRYSRESVKVFAESGAAFGTVLTRRSEDSVYVPLMETEGTLGDAHAILIADLPASTETQPGLVLRGYAIINGTNLVFDSSVTLKAAAIDALRDRGFVVKEVPGDVDA